jgi:hypothetical protein
MLATLAIWVYSFALFYIYGYGGLIFLKKILRLQNGITLSFPIIAMLGAVAVTTLTSFLSLLMPLSAPAAGLILLGAILITIFTQPWKNSRLSTYHPLVIILLFIVTIVVLENSTHRPINYDTALYHAQAIHWIESYHAVPGLANIHDRLAFNSSWLVLTASLSFAFLGLRSFHLTNGLITLLALFYLGEGFQSLIHRQISLSSITKAILFFLPLYYYASDLSSPDTDVPVILLTWVITVFVLEKVEIQSLDFDLHTVIVFVFSVFAVTAKLSAIPLVIFAILAWIQLIRSGNWRNSIFLAAVAIIILLPWLLRNLVLSGYLIFPVPQIDLFSFDWKLPHSAAVESNLVTLWFNRFPQGDWQQYMGMGMPLPQWLPLWFHQLPDRGQKILVLIACASPLGFLTQVFSRQKLNKAYVAAFLINYAGILFWIFTSSLLRFGYGFLLACIVLACAPALIGLVEKIKNNFAMVSRTLLVLTILSQMYLLITTVDLSNIRKRILLPVDYFPSQVQACPIGNTTFYCAKTPGLCNYDAFPCLPKPRSNVSMRGASLQDGFRTNQEP